MLKLHYIKCTNKATHVFEVTSPDGVTELFICSEHLEESMKSKELDELVEEQCNKMLIKPNGRN